MSSTSKIFKPFQMVYKSRKHVLEMLEDRGYDVDDYKNYTENEIRTLLIQHNSSKFETKSEIGPLDIVLEKENIDTKKKEKIYVKYRLDEKFKKTENLLSQIIDIYDTHISKDDTLVILNLGRILTKPGTKDKTDEEFVKSFYLTKGYYIQLFGLENFLFNVSRHQFVPKHIILNKSEIIKMAKQFNINNLRNLPIIKRNEPQAKYIGLRPKQVCKIMKNNVTSGETIEFRLCAN